MLNCCLIYDVQFGRMRLYAPMEVAPSWRRNYIHHHYHDHWVLQATKLYNVSGTLFRNNLTQNLLTCN